MLSLARAKQAARCFMLARGLSPSVIDADDLAQELMVSEWLGKKRDWNWVFLDVLRKQQEGRQWRLRKSSGITRARNVNLAMLPAPDYEERLIAKVDAQRLLKQLPIRQRHAVRLQRFDGLTTAELKLAAGPSAPVYAWDGMEILRSLVA